MTLILALLSVHDADAGSLAISEGTFELGGRATANIIIDGNTDIYLDLSPTLGFFVTPNLELLGGVSLLLTDGDVAAAFFAGMDYVFKGGGARPYLGASVGYGAAELPWFYGGFYNRDFVTLSARGGGLIPLNKKVALDLGGRINLNFENGASWVHIPLGYVGIRAFFP